MHFLKIFFYILLFFPIALQAQNSILPLTGAKIFSSGLSAKSIEISVDGYILLNNTVPLNKEVVFKIINPTGFATESMKIFPAAEVTVNNGSGSMLGKTADAFASVASTGYTTDKAKELIIKTGLGASVIKGNTSLNITINLTDRKSKQSMKIIFPLTIATASQGLQASSGVMSVKSNGPNPIYTSNIKVASAETFVDTAIRVNPAMAYRSLELTNIAGATIDEVLAGTETYYVYHATTLAEVKLNDKLLKRVKAGVEGNVSSYLLKIPYRLKKDNTKYIVRFRWESKEGKRVIDGVFAE